MKYFTREVKIGIAGIMALCILVYGINYLKGIQLFRPTVYFYVKYKNINGLVKSSPVFIDGYQVGLVRNIYYNYADPGNVTVEIGLNANMHLPKGSSAQLITEMLGEVRMNILTADSREYYAVGDTLPGVLNHGLMESITAYMPHIEKMIPKLDSILTTLNILLNNPNIPATLHSIKGTAEHLETTSIYLENFMKKDVPKLTEKLNTIEDNFVIISDNLKGINFASTFRDVDATITNVKMFTDDLNNKNSPLHLLLTDPKLYDNLNGTVRNASNLFEDLKQNPQRYVHFSLFGKRTK
ncbi:MAG: MlaD family protein [Mediterranea sp.]|jgi:phospholipid/cholesterol/gamma-HCH transport system substrate-binding protein|nr:MlaD family protein [Mediterranea sp.]